MLDDILSSVSDNIHYGMGYSDNKLVKININKYILIIENKTSYIGSYPTKADAFDQITKKRLLLSQNEDDDNGYFRAVIINIKHIIPRFFGIKSHRSTKKGFFVFYNCTYNYCTSIY